MIHVLSTLFFILILILLTDGYYVGKQENKKDERSQRYVT